MFTQARAVKCESKPMCFCFSFAPKKKHIQHFVDSYFVKNAFRKMELSDSVRSRLALVARIRSGDLPIFDDNAKFEGACGLKLVTGKFADGVEKSILYARPATNTCILKICLSNGVSLCLKIFRHHSQFEPEEIRFLRFFSDIVCNGISPHLLFPMGEANVDEEIANGLIGEDALEQPLKAGRYSAILAEAAHDSLTNLIFSTELSPYMLKCLLFQTIYTLAAIQSLYPSFRHNDLHASNILVQLADPKFCVYKVSEALQFFVDHKQCPYRAIVWDFFYSTISDQDTQKTGLKKNLENAKASAKFKGVPVYSDIHQLFDSLDMIFDTEGCATTCPDDLWKLMVFVVPEELRLRIHNKTQIIREDHAHKITFSALLCHSYFQELLVPPKHNKKQVATLYKFPDQSHPFVKSE